MADAKNLFARHWKQFVAISTGLDVSMFNTQALIYSACILAEAIRNEQDSVDFRVIEPVKKEEDVHIEI